MTAADLLDRHRLLCVAVLLLTVAVCSLAAPLRRTSLRHRNACYAAALAFVVVNLAQFCGHR